MTSLAVARGHRWRWIELFLLSFPAAILLLGLSSIELARSGAIGSGAVVRWLIFTGLLAVVHLWLNWRLPASDELLLPIGAALAALGFVMMERLVPELAVRQSMWLAISVASMLALLSLLPSVQWLRAWKYTWAAAGLALVAITFAFGADPGESGARLWLGVGGVFFQPSEALKILLVTFSAAYLDEKRELLTWAGYRLGPLWLPPLPYFAPLLIMLGLSLAAVILQRDLGAGLLYFGVFLALLYVASGRLSYVALGLAAFLGGGLLVVQSFAHARLRFELWLDPWKDADGSGYQIVQALIALASGGVLGSGLTFGYPRYIPAVHTDFVIAAIGEELGLAGTLATLCLYAVWLQRGLTIALRAQTSFGTLLAVGLTTAASLQALIILGGNLRLIPLTGITLPFVSYGGSSLLVNFIMLGLLLAVSAEGRGSAPGWRGDAAVASPRGQPAGERA